MTPKTKIEKKTFFIATSPRQTALPIHYWTLGEALAAMGHRVVLLIDKRHVELQSENSNPAVHVWPSFRPTRLRDALFLWRLIQQYRPHCLIANFSSVNWMLLCGWLAGVPFRIAYYHTLKKQIVIGRLKSIFSYTRSAMVHRLATHCIAPSQASKEDCSKALKVPLKKIHVLVCTVPDMPPPASSLGSRSDNLKIVSCAARLYPTKGQDVLIRAAGRLFARPLAQDWQIRLMGTGEMMETYKNLAQKTGHPERIQFTGAVPMEEVYKQVAASTVFVLPSLMDNAPVAIMEAMCFGIPIIASRCGGIPEMIRDGVEGFLFPPGDDEVLAQKLERLLTDATLRENMKQKSRERFLDVYEQSKAVNQQARWYEELVGS